MKKKNALSLCLSFLLIGVIILLAVSCGSQRTFQANQPEKGLGRYVIVEIPDFKTPLDFVPADAVWRIPNRVAEKLRSEEVFVGVSRSSVDISDRVLVLKGSIVGFAPRKWYEQIVGTVTVTANVRFIDKADDSVAAEATFEGVSKGGAISGGIPFAYRRLADEIVQYIKLNQR